MINPSNVAFDFWKVWELNTACLFHSPALCLYATMPTYYVSETLALLSLFLQWATRGPPLAFHCRAAGGPLLAFLRWAMRGSMMTVKQWATRDPLMAFHWWATGSTGKNTGGPPETHRWKILKWKWNWNSTDGMSSIGMLSVGPLVAHQWNATSEPQEAHQCNAIDRASVGPLGKPSRLVAHQSNVIGGSLVGHQ